VGRTSKAEAAFDNMTRINTAGVLIVHGISVRLKELETIASSITVAFNSMRLHFDAPIYVNPLGYRVRKMQALT
jgi:hypothetical protein